MVKVRKKVILLLCFGGCGREEAMETKALRIKVLLVGMMIVVGLLTACDGDDAGGDSTNNGNLTWQNPAPGDTYTLQGAIEYCAGISIDGHSDWRLPTISELRNLIRGCAYTKTGGSCNIEDGGCLSWDCRDDSCGGCENKEGPADGCYWPDGMNGSDGGYWSSSPVECSGDHAWGVDFNSGLVISDGVDDFPNTLHVRCVR